MSVDNAKITYLNICDTMRQFSDDPGCQFAAIGGQSLLPYQLAVIMRLSTLTRNDLLLDRDQDYVEQTRKHV